MLKRIGLFLIILRYLTLSSIAQNNNFEVQLNHAKHDTIKARLYNLKAWEIRFSDPLKSIDYANKALAISYKYNLIQELSNGFKAKAHGYLNQRKFIEGLQLYDSAIHFAKKSNNLHLIASCFNKKAGAFIDLGDYDQAILYYIEGLNAALKTNNNRLKSQLCNNLADAYQTAKRNTALAQKYFSMAADFSLAINDFSHASLSLANLAKEYSMQKLFDKAKIELNRSVDLLNKLTFNTYEKAGAQDVIASTYEDMGELNLAKQFATWSYHTIDSLKMPDNVLRPLLVLSSVDFKLNNLAESKKSTTLLLEIALERNAKVFIKEAFYLLSKIAKQEKDFKQALTYFEQYKNWNDIVFATERDKNVSILEFKANVAKKEIETKFELQTKENLNKELASDNFKLRIAIAIFILAFLLIALISFLLLKSNKNNRRINEELQVKNTVVEQQAKDKEALIQEVHHRVKNNLTMLQSMLYLQAKSAEDENVRLVLSESQTRILSMAIVHQHLYENDREGKLDLIQFLKNLLDEISVTFSSNKYKSIAFKTSGTCDEIGIKIAVPLGLIINEFITNSLKYAFQENTQNIIEIDVSQTKNRISIIYSDNGPGLSKPFEEYNAGFGFKIVRILANQLNAKIDYSISEGKPTFKISFPV